MKKHPKNCICKDCTNRALQALVVRLHKYRPQPPKNVHATVLVRSYVVKAHFRKNHRHLNKNPVLKAAWEGILRGLMNPKPTLKVVRGGRRR